MPGVLTSLTDLAVATFEAGPTSTGFPGFGVADPVLAAAAERQYPPQTGDPLFRDVVTQVFSQPELSSLGHIEGKEAPFLMSAAGVFVFQARRS